MLPAKKKEALLGASAGAVAFSALAATAYCLVASQTHTGALNLVSGGVLLAGNAAGNYLHQIANAIYDRTLGAYLTKLDLARNHHVASAMRNAQLDALRAVFEVYETSRRYSPFPQETDFIAATREFLKTAKKAVPEDPDAFGRIIHRLNQGAIAGLTEKPPATETETHVLERFVAERQAVLRRLAEEAVLDELRAGVGEIPPEFLTFFGHPGAGWYAKFVSLVVARLKDPRNPQFRKGFEAAQIATIGSDVRALIDATCRQYDELRDWLNDFVGFPTRRRVSFECEGLDRFAFWNPRIPFLGREEPIERIVAFMTEPSVETGRPANFSWWPVVGGAGSGKSRLALEICDRCWTGEITLAGESWDAAFLRDVRTLPNQASLWRPKQPTLIVIDYVLKDAEAVGALIDSIQDQTFSHPLRFLLLEREWTETLDRRLFGVDAGRRTKILSHRYRSEPLSLPDDDGVPVYELARHYVEGRSTGAEEYALEAGRFVGLLRRIDPLLRPLSALLLADFLASGGRPTASNSLQGVLENLIERERKTRWQAGSKPLREPIEEPLLALGTMIHGLDIGQARDLPPSARELFSKADLRAFAEAGLPVSDGVRPVPIGWIEPDLIGEFFALSVASRMDNLRLESLYPWIGEAAWRLAPKQMFDFIRRSRQNFRLEICDRLASPVSGVTLSYISWVEREVLSAMRSGESFLLATERAVERVRPFAEQDVAAAQAVGDVTLGVAGADDAAPLIAYLSELTEVHPHDSELKRNLASSLSRRGDALTERGRLEDAISVYDDIVARFSASPEPVLREVAAAALVTKGIRFGSMERLQDEIAAYGELVARFGEAPEPALRIQLAMAMLNKTIRLEQLDRWEEAIDVSRDMVARFGKDSSPNIQEKVGKALIKAAILLTHLKRSEEAIEFYDDVIARSGKASELTLRELVSLALVNKGMLLHGQGRSREAIDIFDDVIARMGDAAEPALRAEVVNALRNKTGILGKSGLMEEANSTIDEMAARFGNAPELALREKVADMLSIKANALRLKNRWEEAIAAHDEIVSRFGQAPEVELRRRSAIALVAKADLLSQLGRSEEAIAADTNLIALVDDAPEPAVRNYVIVALVNKATRLEGLERLEDAIAIYGDLVARFSTAPEAREPVGMALVNKGRCLEQLDRFEEAIAVYDDAATRFVDASEPILREFAAKALVNKGHRLGRLERPYEAIAAYDEVVARFGEAPEPALRRQVAMALLNKGGCLKHLDRREEAIVIYDDVIGRLSRASDPALPQLVAEAAIQKASALAGLKRFAEALITCESAYHLTMPGSPLFNQMNELRAVLRNMASQPIQGD